MKRIHPFTAGFYFLTSLPVTKEKVPFDDIARGLWTFPFIGLFIGMILSVTGIIVYEVFPALLGPAVLLVIWVWITGALHVDGFIDCCDALLSPKPEKERLIILKDVATGSFGVTGAILLFLVKYSALMSIVPGAIVIVLPLATVAGRSAILYVMYRFPCARLMGLGKVFKDRIKGRHLVVSLCVLLFTASGCFFFYSPFYLGLIIIGTTVILSELFGAWVLQRIPGFTGDVYGATCELVEAVVLVTAGIVLKAAA